MYLISTYAVYLLDQSVLYVQVGGQTVGQERNGTCSCFIPRQEKQEWLGYNLLVGQA